MLQRFRRWVTCDSLENVMTAKGAVAKTGVREYARRKFLSASGKPGENRFFQRGFAPGDVLPRLFYRVCLFAVKILVRTTCIMSLYYPSNTDENHSIP